MDKAQRLKRISRARDLDLDETQAIAVLDQEMRSADSDLRAAAAEAVCDYYHVPSLVETCMDLARKDTDAGVRVRAIHSLGFILDDGCPDSEPEEEGESGVGGEIDPSTFTTVKSLLLQLARAARGQDDPGHSAVEVLGWLGNTAEVREVLEAQWERAEPGSRAAALIAAGRANLREWEPRVLEALESRGGKLLVAALKAVASMALRKAAARVQELCSHTDPDVRNAAVLAVPSVLSARRAKSLLKSLRQHKDPDTRRMVRSAKEILEEDAGFEDPEDENEDFDEDDDHAEFQDLARERAVLREEFRHSIAFGKAPPEIREWLPGLADRFFQFLQDHQGIDLEEFEPCDLQEFLLEFLPVHLDIDKFAGFEKRAPEGLGVLVRFMADTRRFVESTYMEALDAVITDFHKSIAEPNSHSQNPPSRRQLAAMEAVRQSKLAPPTKLGIQGRSVPPPEPVTGEFGATDRTRSSSAAKEPPAPRHAEDPLPPAKKNKKTPATGSAKRSKSAKSDGKEADR